MRKLADEHNETEMQLPMRNSLMKKTLLMLGFMLLPTLAMAAPNFSGTWVLDNAVSDPNPYPLFWITRAAPQFYGRFKMLMTVHQNGDSMQVVDSERPVRNYTLNGEPQTRPTDTLLEKAVVTAKWQGDDLVIETTKPYGGMPGNITLKQTEEWSLSPDGKTLTVTITRDSAARQKTLKEVYNMTQSEEGKVLCSDGCIMTK